MADQQIFGRRWRVVRKLGSGGQGVVYEVEDTRGTPAPMDAALQLGELLAECDRVYTNSQERARVSPLLANQIKSLARQRACSSPVAVGARLQSM